MRVDFYLLGAEKNLEHVVFALCNKAYQQAWRIGIHGKDETLNKLDEILWSHQANSFLPHQTIKTTRCQSSIEPIMLFQQAPDDINTLDYYINLRNEITPYKNKSGRLADIITSDEDSKTLGRERYSYYKQQAELKLNYHELK